MPENEAAKWWHWILNHPKFAGFLAFVALAITFSPRASMTGTWICLGAAFVFGLLMVVGLKRKGDALVWIAVCLLAVSLFSFGEWLTGKKSPILATTPTIPRIGNGPDAYKEIPNGVLAQMLDNEAGKLGNDVKLCDATDSTITVPGSDTPWKTTREGFRNQYAYMFMTYDMPDLQTLHDEAFRRLGPGAKNALIEDMFVLLGKTTKDDGDGVCETIPNMVPYFKKLATDLKLMPSQ
jgi:energy-coupling factor transporter transmembrane protein EcfT